MPRFYFAVRTETHVLLADAVDLSDVEDARLEAARRVGNLLKTHAEILWTDQEWQMDITDEQGLILFVIHISAMRTSATMSAR